MPEFQISTSGAISESNSILKGDFDSLKDKCPPVVVGTCYTPACAGLTFMGESEIDGNASRQNPFDLDIRTTGKGCQEKKTAVDKMS
jgi:hypothetical protein